MSPHPAPQDVVEHLEGEDFFRIDGVDALPPFLVSVVSDSDLWMYVSSRGALTAGRIDADRALFPYVTDDQLHTALPYTGPVTMVRVQAPSGAQLWEPWLAPDAPGLRSLLKSETGNTLVFEERHDALGLRLRTRWAPSDDFGFVRTVTFENTGAVPVTLDVVDGLRNLMPAGVPLGLQQGASCLANAYTRVQLDPVTKLGVFALQAQIVDRAIPAESLRATCAWVAGLDTFDVLVSTDQLPAFRRGVRPRGETGLKGRRGAYLVSTSFTLAPGGSKSWDLLADVDRGHLEVEAVRALLRSRVPVRALIETSRRQGTARLRRLVAGADGLQITADRRATAHHFADVLFNVMRGGTFADGDRIPARDFQAFVAGRSRTTATREASFLTSLPPTLTRQGLADRAEATGDLDLVRLAAEYLPISFSRRHGDPSRPWNRFRIHVRNADGTPALAYEGNWRDIFQNWEALCESFPEYLESVITKFVNASTIDGFNPYRISRDGIDWEIPDPEDAWSNIGYWGDHQIIYLLRLLDASARHHPGRLEALLSKRIFCTADVPYRLKGAAEIAANPRDTIVFDTAHHRRIEHRIEAEGSDGRLRHDADGTLSRRTLGEKLLIPILSKLSNLVVDGGVWMNTQRPEWNDANNALVGNGLSVVTLCQLRRHLAFCIGLYGRGPETLEISNETRAWLDELGGVLSRHAPVLDGDTVSDRDRRTLLDALQASFETYRTAVTATTTTHTQALAASAIVELLRIALRFVDHSIRANRRADGLWHSYNLLDLATPGEARVARLQEMLEGQVAVLSSGVLSAAEAITVVDALFASALFRADQATFLLYPDRELPGFFEKNVVPVETIATNPLLSALVDARDRSVIAVDLFGVAHFNSAFHTLDDVRAAVASLGKSEDWSKLAREFGESVVATFSKLFGFDGFTGRSGTMYGYEGLGCIYWHMVSKLLLAVQEVHDAAVASAAPADVVQRLAHACGRLRDGMGYRKTVEQYGAFPSDPYSHTPGHAGAQQPGMTGAVKEDILSRFGELGVTVDAGRIAFRPTLLGASEFLATAAPFTFVGVDGREYTIRLAAGELAFTYCQIPVVYVRGPARSIVVRRASGAEVTVSGDTLDAPTSEALFRRTGEVTTLIVTVP